MLSCSMMLFMQLAIHAAVCQFDTEVFGIFKTMQSIQSKDVHTHLRALKQLDAFDFRSTHIQKILVHIIDNPLANTNSYHSSKNIALYYLAQNVDYRSDSKFIHVFIDNIAVSVPTKMFVRELQAPDKLCPSLRGLLRIGERATGPLLSKIKITDDKSILSSIACWHFKYYGRRMALNYFQDILDDNTLKIEERKRIVWVVELIENNSW
jgi:hypothetical protein